MKRDTNEGKVRYDLIIPLNYKNPLLKEWAELMGRGAIKYLERNWEKASTLEEYLRFKESAFRHFMQWYFDETDESHAAAVCFNMQGADYVKTKLKSHGTSKTLRRVSSRLGHKRRGKNTSK